MSRIEIKQGYIVKPVLFLSFLFVISLGLIGGCSDGGGGNDSQALTENDFAEDSSLRADPEGVVVTFLESPMSEEAENDTGQVGVDLIPVTYRRTVEQTFCWEDDDLNAMHFMELRDSEDNVIMTVEVNGDCVTAIIEEGEWVYVFHHDESDGGAQPIFIIPDPDLEEAMKTDGFIDGFKLAASNVLKRIEETVTRDARAQTVIENTQTIFRTNSCVECNLDRARLRNATLIGVNLSGANLHLAELGGANLTDANLSSAIMNATLAREAVFIGADMRGASMFLTFLGDADLSGADLSGATMNQTILRNADLSGAIMDQAIVNRADFSSATWCDGNCVCAQGSSGTCNGCAPISICTGP